MASDTVNPLNTCVNAPAPSKEPASDASPLALALALASSPLTDPSARTTPRHREPRRETSRVSTPPLASSSTPDASVARARTTRDNGPSRAPRPTRATPRPTRARDADVDNVTTDVTVARPARVARMSPERDARLPVAAPREARVWGITSTRANDPTRRDHDDARATRRCAKNHSHDSRRRARRRDARRRDDRRFRGIS